ncbi:tetratricopeptide repeat protein [Methanolobus sp. ZRKC2]|uniref:tetratricopeptide repeat protein n=1 Tax=Methanolobus sp. ZRKC2 TaxID=3125783 RepID=UPI00324C09FC
MIEEIFGAGSIAYQVVKDYSTRRQILRKYYNFSWKQSAGIEPEPFFGYRFKYYNDYYFSRKEDNKIEKSIKNNKNILILGRPMSGKSRAAFEVFKKLEESCFIIKPRAVDIEIDEFRLPSLPGNRKRVLFLDDLHIFAEKKNFHYLFEVAREKKLIIVATCRSEFEYDFLKKKLPTNISVEDIFDTIIDYPKISTPEAQSIALDLDIDWSEANFDGTIGSLIMKLGSMETRYKKLNQKEKAILRILKKLYCAGISEEDKFFFIDTIRDFAKAKGIIHTDNDLDQILVSLISKEFIENPEENVYQVEEIYLEKIFDFDTKTNRISIFHDMASVFHESPNILVKVAIKAYSLGLVRYKKSAYTKISIETFGEALKVYTFHEFPKQYALIQNDLGNAYGSLAEVEDKKNNFKKAIKAYEEALRVYSFDKFPIQYAMIRNNMGTAYGGLAEIMVDKKNNLEKAIEAFEEALRVYTFDKFPIQCAMTQNNMGTIYSDLAEILVDKESNLEIAIEAFEKALRVYTFDRFPIQYATVQNNMGIVYSKLADIEDKKSNLEKAIKVYKEALKVYSFDEFPSGYAMVQNNMGTVYSKFADIEDKKSNLEKAIKAYKEALRVYTFDEFFIDYSMVQKNIGIAYSKLAGIEDKEK